LQDRPSIFRGAGIRAHDLTLRYPSKKGTSHAAGMPLPKSNRRLLRIGASPQWPARRIATYEAEIN
jgi:hypothetical protein